MILFEFCWLFWFEEVGVPGLPDFFDTLGKSGGRLKFEFEFTLGYPYCKMGLSKFEKVTVESLFFYLINLLFVNYMSILLIIDNYINFGNRSF